MICRLCFNTIHKKNATSLFCKSDNYDATELIKLIKKHIEIEITKDDVVSTNLCSDCRESIEEFHSFCLYVNQKQKNLRIVIKTNVVKQKAENSDILEEEFLVDMEDMDYNEDNIEYVDEISNNVSQMNETNEKKEHIEEDHQQQQLQSKSEKPKVDNDDLLEQSDSDFEAQQQQENAEIADDIILEEDDFENEALETEFYADENETNDNTNDMWENDDDIDYIPDTIKRATSAKVTLQSRKTVLNKTKDNKNKHSTAITVIKQNEETINNNMALSCDLCNQAMENYANLRRHFKKVHDHIPYIKCCEKIFYKASQVVEHIALHQNPDIFTCKLCNKTMASAINLTQHMKVVHDGNNKPLPTCPICKKVFTHKKWFETHMDLHDAENTHCKLCAKSFPTKQGLQRHVDAVHENIFPHVCDICGKKFKYKPCFTRHIQLHQGLIEQPLQCEICDRWLKNKHSLRIHIAAHNSQEVKCEICERIFPGKKNLKRHMDKTHNTQKNLSCTFCEKTFKFERNLEEHIASHTGEQLYACPHCLKESRSLSTMYMHIKRFHVEEWNKAKIVRSNNPHLLATLKT